MEHQLDNGNVIVNDNWKKSSRLQSPSSDPSSLRFFILFRLSHVLRISFNFFLVHGKEHIVGIHRVNNLSLISHFIFPTDFFFFILWPDCRLDSAAYNLWLFFLEAGNLKSIIKCGTRGTWLDTYSSFFFFQ